MRTAGSIFRRRSWIALAAVYALALQVLFSGVLIGQMGAASVGADALAAICAAHSGSVDDTGSGQPVSAHDLICVFCTTAGSPAVLPHRVAVADVPLFAALTLKPQARDIVVAFASPTGHYQRGPPDSTAIAG